MRFLMVLLFVPLFGCAQADDETRSLPISIKASANTLEASGRWVTEQKLDVPLLAKANTVQIRCHRETMACTEAVAVLMTSKDDPRMSGQALFSILSEYAVESWTDSRVRAKSEKRAADVILEFDLTSQSVTRRHQETKARGNETADPNFIVEWRLR